MFPVDCTLSSSCSIVSKVLLSAKFSASSALNSLTSSVTHLFAVANAFLIYGYS